MGRMTPRAAIAALVVVAACGGDDRAADAPSGPYARMVADAVPKIEKAVGLTFKTPPKVEKRSKDEVRQFLENKFNEESPAREIASLERAYKRLGMLPDSLALRTFMLELLAEQVVGYYDPATKILYIVDGAPNEMISVTVGHELIHALQDQYLDLDSIQKIEGDNDRQVAAQSVIEGQATYEQLQAMMGGGNIATQLPGGWDRMREVIRESQSSMPIFAGAPTLIQETLIFPYLSGAEFIRRFEGQRPGTVPFGDMPQSTEQVLHESSYFGTRDTPTAVVLPPLDGATLVYQNNLGEFETRLFLFQHLQDQAAAARGAAGWDGDRYALFSTNGGEGVAWITTWDSAVDSGEFFDLMDTAISKRFPGARPVASTVTTRTYSAGTRQLALTASEVMGRPVVLFVDAPAGARVDVLDVGKVQLRD